MVVNKKRLLHHRKKIQYQKHYQEIQQQKEQKLLNHGYNGKERFLGLSIRVDTLKDPEELHNYRNMVLDYTSNNQRSKATSRITLQEFATVEVNGLVTDVKDNGNGYYQLLVDHPTIVNGVFKGESREIQRINRLLDSHIWISVNSIIGYNNQEMHYLPTISIADTIRFVAHVKTYKGRVGNHYVTKYGLTDICIKGCGIPIQGRNQVYLKSMFNRFGDWVIRFTSLPDISTDETMHPGKFEYRPSKWFHYEKRMEIQKSEK